MTGYGTRVTLIAYTTAIAGLDDPTKLIEYAGRTCANSVDKLGTDPTWVQKRIMQGHESIIEHGSATFEITCSRTVTHELVRHRLASYSQRSQRYAKEDGCEYFTPPELNKPAYHDFMTNIFEMYRLMLDDGIKPEIARYILPNAWRTHIIMTMNFRELRHFIKLRTSTAALPEMQEVANKVKDLCEENWPEIFKEA